MIFEDYTITAEMRGQRLEEERMKAVEADRKAAFERDLPPAGLDACTDPDACDDPPSTLYAGLVLPIVRFAGGLADMALADKLAIGGCILNITTKGTIGVYETLGVSIARNDLGWDNVTAGYLFASGGAGGVCALLSFSCLVKTFGDINLVTWGLAR